MTMPTGGAPGQAFEARAMSISDVDERFIEQWLALEARSLEANAYLSPHFVLPVLRRLERSGHVSLIAVFASDGGDPRLVGLGVFRLTPGNRRFPLTHLSALGSIHSYLSGLLVDARLAELVLEAFFGFLTRPGVRWHGVAFTDWRAEGPLGQAMLRAAERASARWHKDYGFQRATLIPGRLDGRSFETALGRCSGKSWRKKVQRMVDHGEVQWRFLSGQACDAAAVERFLVLEDRGWAREEGSSLKAAGHDDLFRELCQGFSRDGRLFFTELLLGGEVIASTSNFISGGAGFAFKIGWNSAFASLRPGLLNEVLFLREARQLCPGLAYFDSGTGPGSYMEAFWDDRVALESGVFATSRLGRVAARSWDGLRWVRRSLRGLLGRWRPRRSRHGAGVQGGGHQGG
jgi:CelD/BcsL family acetyltransferase involved in cellulose biosynthesis